MAGSRFLTLVNGAKQWALSLTASAGAASAGSLVALNASGVVDATMMPYNWSIGEVPAGPVAGAYTAAHTPIAGSLVVYINGLRRQSGAGNDYTVSGAAITPLVTVNSIVIDYRY